MFAIDQILSQITSAASNKQQTIRNSKNQSGLFDSRRRSSASTQNNDILLPSNMSSNLTVSDESLQCPTLPGATRDSVATSIPTNAKPPSLPVEATSIDMYPPLNDVTDNTSVQCNELNGENEQTLNFSDETPSREIKVAESDENKANIVPNRKISRFLVSPVFEQNTNADQERISNRRESVEVLSSSTSVEITDPASTVLEVRLKEADNNEVQIPVVGQLNNTQHNQVIDPQFYHPPEPSFNDVEAPMETFIARPVGNQSQIMNNADQVFEQGSIEPQLEVPVAPSHTIETMNPMFQAPDSSMFIPQTINNQSVMQQYPLPLQQQDIHQAPQVNNNLLVLQQLQLQLVNEEKNRRISNHSNTSNLSSDSQLSEISFTSDDRKVTSVLPNTPVMPVQQNQFLHQDISNNSLSPHMNIGELPQPTAVIHQSAQPVATLPYPAQSAAPTEPNCKAKTKEVSSTFPDLAQNLANILSNPKSKCVTPHAGSSHEQNLNPTATIVLADYKPPIQSEQYFQPIHPDVNLQSFPGQKCVQGSASFPQNVQISQANNQIPVQHSLPSQQSVDAAISNVLQGQSLGTDSSAQNHWSGSSYGSTISQNSIQSQSIDPVHLKQNHSFIQQVPSLVQPHIQPEIIDDQHQSQQKFQEDANFSKLNEVEGSLDCNILSR